MKNELPNFLQKQTSLGLFFISAISYCLSAF